MPPPTTTTSTKHKPSGCRTPILVVKKPNNSLTSPVPEPAFKRKTLAEKAGEPHNPKGAAPPSARPLSSSVKGTIARPLAASTSRATQKPTYKTSVTSAFGGSVGGVSRNASTNGRPKSAYGQYNGHSRSKSHHQVRPGTTMKNRYEDDDDSEPERKGVQSFPISTNPGHPLHSAREALSASTSSTQSLNGSRRRLFPMSTTRSVSSPSNFLSTAPAIRESTDPICEDVCASFEALTLGNSKADSYRNQIRSRKLSGKAANSFCQPKKSQTHLPQPICTPVRQKFVDQTPIRAPSTTPRKQAPFLNKFTNERCPDFYDDRIEAMERDFRMFKEQMEGDVRQASGFKESIQQLQTRGM